MSVVASKKGGVDVRKGRVEHPRQADRDDVADPEVLVLGQLGDNPLVAVSWRLKPLSGCAMQGVHVPTHEIDQ